MTNNEVMQMALDALEDVDGIDTETECVTIDVLEVIEALRTALAQPEKEWVGLTDEDKKEIYKQADAESWHDQPLLEAVEAKLKEKNT
jgi:lipoate-protein ligase A